MKIEQITYEKPPRWYTHDKGHRCGRKVTHYGTKVKRCNRFAHFIIGGMKLCKQHAGEAALYYLIKQQEVKRV